VPVASSLEHAIEREEEPGEDEDGRVARSLKGARLLIEAGFEYITDMDGYKLFRKRT